MELLENPTVLGAALAAAAALAGVFVSQLVAILAAWVQHGRQHRILLRDKYERVAILFAQSLQWLQTVQAAESMKELQLHAYPSQAREMYSLCLIYFPLLRKPGANYLNCLVRLQNTLVDNFRGGVHATAGAQALQHSREDFLKVSKAIIAARQHMEDGIELHAKQYAAL